MYPKIWSLSARVSTFAVKSGAGRASILLPVVFRCMMKFIHVPMEAE